MKVLERIKSDLRHDVNWNRAGRLTVKGARAFPRASAQYALDKFPIIGWLPKYNLRWLLNDVIAGVTIGLMLIPQGLSYAKIADIPVEYGLMSSWLPPAIYAFTGTSKDLSTGPTSLIGLLTSENVHALQDRWTPSEIASATAFMMGVYGLSLGLLKLGFVLEFISLPVLSGFITAIAITIILNQMDSLLGEDNVGDGAARQIHDIFGQLPNANGWACLIGFSGIVLLTALDHANRRWGKKNKVVWLLGITRAFLTLVLFTGVSYAVNRGREEHLFEVVKVRAQGQEAPRAPRADLLPEVAGRSIAVFIGAAVEHTAIARAFSVRNGYTTDQSQELCYFGVTNVANSFFHAMGVGGAMSRTAVNSSCNVRSPLSGVFTTAVVLVCVYFLVGTLYWIPKATLAAIIITAVWGLISPPKTFYGYWKTSLADFVSSMIALWVSLFVSTEVGIGCAVGFNVVYVLLRQVFAGVSSTGAGGGGSGASSELAAALDGARGAAGPAALAEDVRVFRFGDSLYFCNAFARTSEVLDEVQTFHAPAYGGSHGPEAERNWSVVGEKRVARLQRAAGIRDGDGPGLPGIGLVVLDFGRVNHVDATAVTHLRSLRAGIEKYGGAGVELRFAGMTPYVRQRFERAGWRLRGASDGEGVVEDGEAASEATPLFDSVAAAVMAPRRRASVLSDAVKPTASHDEKAEV